MGLLSDATNWVKATATEAKAMATDVINALSSETPLPDASTNAQTESAKGESNRVHTWFESKSVEEFIAEVNKAESLTEEELKTLKGYLTDPNTPGAEFLAEEAKKQTKGPVFEAYKALQEELEKSMQIRDSSIDGLTEEYPSQMLKDTLLKKYNAGKKQTVIRLLTTAGRDPESSSVVEDVVEAVKGKIRTDTKVDLMKDVKAYANSLGNEGKYPVKDELYALDLLEPKDWNDMVLEALKESFRGKPDKEKLGVIIKLLKAASNVGSLERKWAKELIKQMPNIGVSEYYKLLKEGASEQDFEQDVGKFSVLMHKSGIEETVANYIYMKLNPSPDSSVQESGLNLDQLIMALDLLGKDEVKTVLKNLPADEYAAIERKPDKPGTVQSACVSITEEKIAVKAEQGVRGFYELLRDGVSNEVIEGRKGIGAFSVLMYENEIEVTVANYIYMKLNPSPDSSVQESGLNLEQLIQALELLEKQMKTSADDSEANPRYSFKLQSVTELRNRAVESKNELNASNAKTTVEQYFYDLLKDGSDSKKKEIKEKIKDLELEGDEDTVLLLAIQKCLSEIEAQDPQYDVKSNVLAQIAAYCDPEGTQVQLTFSGEGQQDHDFRDKVKEIIKNRSGLIKRFLRWIRGLFSGKISEAGAFDEPTRGNGEALSSDEVMQGDAVQGSSAKGKERSVPAVKVDQGPSPNGPQ